MNDTDLCTGDNCPIKDKCLRSELAMKKDKLKELLK